MIWRKKKAMVALLLMLAIIVTAFPLNRPASAQMVGSVWFPMDSGITENLYDVWGASRTGDVFAVGAAGTILHYNGSEWTPMDSGTSENLNGVWCSTSGEEAWAGGAATISSELPTGYASGDNQVGQGDDPLHAPTGIINDDEILIADESADWIHIIESDGTGRHFDAPFAEDDGFAVGDVDGDGVDEILIASYRNDKVYIYESDGASRSFDAPFAEDDGFAAGDVDGDGVDEILIAIDEDNKVYMYESNGSSDSFTASFTPNDGFAVGDVDGDGVDEILIASEDLDKVYIYESDGSERHFDARFHEYDGFAAGDVDGDAVDEILIVWKGFDVVHIFESDGSHRHFDVARFDPNDGFAVGAVDTGPEDQIVIAVDRDHKVYIYESDETERYFNKAFEGGDGFALGDVDGDSIRVGAPTHSVLEIVDQVLAVINAPPKHEGVNHIEDLFYAQYEEVEGEKTGHSVKAIYSIATSVGVEGQYGGVIGPVSVRASVETKYKSVLEGYNELIESRTVGAGLTADWQDRCILATTLYDAYEYPVISPPEAAVVDGEQQYIRVTVPQVGGMSTKDETWVSDIHTVGDIRTYPSSATGLFNYSESLVDQREFPMHTDTGSWDRVVFQEQIAEEAKRSTSLDVSMEVGSEVGSKKLGNYVSVTLGVDYGEQKIATHKLTSTDTTKLYIKYKGTNEWDDWDESKDYSVTRYIYYDNEYRHIVLDYTVADIGDYYWQLPVSPASEPLLLADDATVPPGETVWVPVRLENAENLASLGFNLEYDPAVAEVTDVTKGSLLGAFTFVPNYQEPGIVRFGFAAADDISGTGWAAVVEFEAIGPAGSQSVLTLSDILAADADGESLSIDINHGVLTIGAREEGDLNGDGELDEADALHALRMYVKLEPEDMILDMNGDGSVTPDDARIILQQAAQRSS